MNHRTIAIFALGLAQLGAPALATARAPTKDRPASTASDVDADEAARRTGAGGVTYYDYEADLLKGLVLKPGGAQVSAQARARFKSLITVRGLFTPELVRLAKDL